MPAHHGGHITVDLLLAAIGNTTCSGAAQEKANSLFFKRAQKANDDISQFCASLEMLFNRAYEQDQRSHSIFQRQFLIGLKDREITRMLIVHSIRMY